MHDSTDHTDFSTHEHDTHPADFGGTDHHVASHDADAHAAPGSLSAPFADASHDVTTDTDDDAQTTPESDTASSMVGDPSYDMTFWHHQESTNSCAIASQQYIIEQLTGQNVSESDLAKMAQDNGWYTPDGGTPMEDCGKLLAAYGLNTEQHTDASIDDLSAQLAAGHGVFVAVHGEPILAASDPAYAASLPTADFATIPGQGADHAIEVIGIDRSDPNNPMVILNDPDGTAGETVPLSTFMDAWSASDHFMVSAY